MAIITYIYLIIRDEMILRVSYIIEHWLVNSVNTCTTYFRGDGKASK